jgi:hypothetical protein
MWGSRFLVQGSEVEGKDGRLQATLKLPPNAVMRIEIRVIG